MNLKIKRFFVVIMAFSLLGSCLLSGAAFASDKLREIRVNGTQRVEPATVVSYLGLAMGDELTQDTLNYGLKNLYATGLFSDVKLRQSRGMLDIDVRENPIVNRIAFEGNTEIENEALLSEISLRPRQVFTRTKIQNDVSRLYDVYRRSGRFAANIDPKVIELDQNRIDLVFEIDEGDITKVQGIRFTGNETFDDDLLRSEISTQEEHWYSFLSSSDTYDADRIKFDEELLRRFYLSKGYADFEVISSVAELSADKEDFYLTFAVNEGPRYKVGQILIDNEIRNFDAAALRENITVLPGQWYNADMVKESVSAMSDALGDRQFAFVDIRPKIDRDRSSHTVNINFKVHETPRVFVERIDIHGNVRTIDKVIRREFLLAEGDPFSRAKLAESERNLNDLAFFDKVKITNKQGSAPDKTIIDVEVREKSTGEISIGAGFSTADGPLADLRLRERNLLGKGQDVMIGTTIAGKRTQFDFSFTEPYFMDRDFSAGIDLFHKTSDFQTESSYDQKQTGGALRFGFPLSEKWRQTWRYRYERNEITNVQSNASLFIQQQEGQRDTSAISQRLTYDDRDSRLFPTEGLYSWLDSEVAGLGGDAKYVSGKLGSIYYVPVYKKSVVFNLLGEVAAIGGYADEDVKIQERFTLGGSTLRGFKSAGVGPRDSATGDALGGNYYYRGSAELKLPVPGLDDEMGFATHLFTDFGSLWEIDESGAGIDESNSLRAAAGIGLSWRSPMGPVRADFALPYLDENFDKSETFRFSFGTRF